MADLLDSKQFAAKVRAKYPGMYDSLPDNDLTNRVIEKHPEYRSVVQAPPITSGNPTAMANRALELSSPGKGLQVSGKEQNPRAIGNAPLTQTALGIPSGPHSGSAMSNPEAGAVSAALDIGDSMKNAQPPTIGESLIPPPIAGAKTLLYDLPKAAGEHIAGSINAFRGEDPIKGYEQAYEGAGDTAQALSAAKVGELAGGPTVSEGVAPVVRGAAKVGNAAIRNAPEIMTPIGAVSGAGRGVEGALFGGYMGNRLGNFISKHAPTIPGENFGIRTVEPSGPPLSQFSIGQRETSLPQGETAEAPITIPGKITTPPRINPEGFSFTPKPQSPLPGGQSIGTLTSTRPESTSPALDSPAASSTAPTPNEVAQGMGFKNATQAIGRLGPDVWQQTYSKVSGSPTTPPVPIIAPPFEPPSVRPGSPTPFSTPKIHPIEPQSLFTGEDVLRATAGEKPQIAADTEDFGNNIANRMDLEREGQRADLIRGRHGAIGNAAETAKLTGNTAPEAVVLKPLPTGTMEANRLLGYTGRRPIRPEFYDEDENER